MHRRQSLRVLSGIAALIVLSGCTVQPLNGNRSAAYRGDALYYVEPVNTRVGQQVRNALIFGLNGGRNPAEAPYRIKLLVTSSARDVAVETSRQAPTSARVRVDTAWTLTRRDGPEQPAAMPEIVASGERTAVAAYDRTVQRFANKRALQDAENRAAAEAAERVRLAVQQAAVAR